LPREVWDSNRSCNSLPTSTAKFNSNTTLREASERRPAHSPNSGEGRAWSVTLKRHVLDVGLFGRRRDAVRYGRSIRGLRTSRAIQTLPITP
jgi:hypothetical protein